MITDGKKWHYLSLKNVPALFRGVTSNHNGDFSCFHSYTTEKKIKNMKKYVMIMIIVMWKCQMKTKLKYYYGEKSLEFPAIIYADLERLLEKCSHVKIILKNLIQKKKISIHLLVTHCLQIVHLMHQKTDLIVTKGKTAWKSFVKT